MEQYREIIEELQEYENEKVPDIKDPQFCLQDKINGIQSKGYFDVSSQQEADTGYLDVSSQQDENDNTGYLDIAAN